MNRPLAAAAALLTSLALLTAGGQAASAHTAADAGRAPTTVTKVLVFVVENHSLQQVRKGMPWVSDLADQYAYATGYHAITHPSLPNYLAMAGGSTFGITDDDPPAYHPLRGSSVFGRALAAGQTATTYAEGMTSNCRLSNVGNYAVRHNPWTYFKAERAACRAHDVPLSQLAGDIDAGDLPNVGMVIPDVCNDAHDCSLSTADDWLQTEVGAVLAGPDFASGDLAVVITADEDDRAHGNQVLTVVAQSDLSHVVVKKPLTHYALTRALAEVGGAKAPGHGASARSLLAAFGLSAG